MSTIHLISHTHWDREWYLPFQQFRLKLVKLIDHLFEILKSDVDFQFYLLDGQTILLEDYLQIKPDKEEEIVKYIKNGRIFIGPWYVSPNEFLVAPESHIRNLLLGDKLCQKYAGKMRIGYLPDTFGHIGQMPQLLNEFAIDSACVWRGLSDQYCELIWKSPDGSSVLLANLRDSYSNAANLVTSDTEKFASQIDELSVSLSPYVKSDHILLMHGTDHMEPPDNLGTAIQGYRSRPHPKIVIHSNLPHYFKELRSHIKQTGQELPIITGELRSSKKAALLQNVLSTRINLKQRNHQCETDLLKWAEPFYAWIGILNDSANASSPSLTLKTDRHQHNVHQIINYAWALLMQCHPHDSICGTSIDQVAKEMEARFDQVDQINHDLISHGFLILCTQIDTEKLPGSLPSELTQGIFSSILVFNATDTDNTGIAEFRIKLDKTYSSFEIIDEFGNKIPYHRSGMKQQELISMILDKKEMKQSLAMIHEGNVAGMVIRDFKILQKGTRANIQVTLSDHGYLDANQWKRGLQLVERMIASPDIDEFFIHAITDPEMSISLIARNVPGHGYLTYWIRGTQEIKVIPSQPIRLQPFMRFLLPIFSKISRQAIFKKLPEIINKRPIRSPMKIENEFFLVEPNYDTGTIDITDKRTNQVYSGFNRFIDGGDSGDLYNYCPPEIDQLIPATIQRIEYDHSEIYQKMIIHYHLLIPRHINSDRRSRGKQQTQINILSEITLVPGVPRVDIATDIDNQATDHRLRVHFPASFDCTTAWYDGHFEIVERPISLPEFDDTWVEPPRPEVPQREFARVSDGKNSLTIANRGLPEVEVFHNSDNHAEIAITLLRCVGWLSRDDITTRKGHAGPMGIETPGAQMTGKHTFYYSIIIDGSDWHQSIQQAQSFNVPIRAIQSVIHSGILSYKSSLIDNNNIDFLITSIKPSKQGEGLVVRGYNILATPIEITLKPWKHFNKIHLTMMDERVLRELYTDQEGLIKLQVEGHKIISIQLSD